MNHTANQMHNLCAGFYRNGFTDGLAIKKRAYYVMGGFQSTTRFFDGLMYIVVVVAGGIFLVKGGIGAADYIKRPYRT